MRTLSACLTGGQVKRFHTERTIGQETVAEHSFGVAIMCHYLCEKQPTARLINAALFHDLAESVTGDSPAPTKWKHPILDTVLKGIEEDFEKEHGLDISLTEEEKIILKCADSLQCMWYCIEQRKLGNQNMDDIFHRLTVHMVKVSKNTANAVKLLNEYRYTYRELQNGSE